MPLRIGPGPIFVVELVAGARRWQMFLQRSALILLLLGVLTFVLVSEVPLGDTKNRSLGGYAELGQKFSEAVLTTQLVLILLGVPAAMAGAVCSDKARGKLELILVTDLSSAEIVLGTLCSRLVRIFGLIIASLPVLFITGLMGGLSWEFLLCGFVTLFGAGIVSTTLSLAFAVWATKPHNAIWNAYVVLFWWLMAHNLARASKLPTAFSDLLFRINPIALLYGPTQPTWGITLADYGIYLAVTACVSALLAALASWRLRRVVQVQRKQVNRTWQPSVRAKLLGQHLLDCNPLRWYERHRRIPTPEKFATYGGVAIAWIMTTILAIWQMNTAPGMAYFVASAQVLLGILWITIDSVTALAVERTRGNLEVLLATPFSSRYILYSKWRAGVAWILLIFGWPLLVVAVDCLTRKFNGNLDTNFGVVVLLLPYLMSAATFYVCLGLFLAIWLRLMDQAIGTAVTFIVVAAVAWPYLVITLAGINDDVWYLIGVSPPAALIAMALDTTSTSIPHISAATIIWTLLYGTGSALLYRLTLRNFDQSFGRITNRAKPSGSGIAFRLGTTT